MHRKTLIIYTAAALALILCAGCGWSSGPPFAADYADFDPDTYDPGEATPIEAVQAWFASLEFRREADDSGVKVPDPESGRDFDLWLTLVNPEAFNPEGQPIGRGEMDELRDIWDSPDWFVEFLDISLEEEHNDGREARVEIVGGGIRYIGVDFFESPEYRQDSFGDKKGVIYLKRYEDTVNDPLFMIAEVDDGFRRRFGEIAGKPRWVVVGGLDLSEDLAWPEQP